MYYKCGVLGLLTDRMLSAINRCLHLWGLFHDSYRHSAQTCLLFKSFNKLRLWPFLWHTQSMQNNLTGSYRYIFLFGCFTDLFCNSVWNVLKKKCSYYQKDMCALGFSAHLYGMLALCHIMSPCAIINYKIKSCIFWASSCIFQKPQGHINNPLFQCIISGAKAILFSKLKFLFSVSFCYLMAARFLLLGTPGPPVHTMWNKTQKYTRTHVHTHTLTYSKPLLKHCPRLTQ